MATTDLHINDLAGGAIIRDILCKYIAVHPLDEDRDVSLCTELFRLSTVCCQWMRYLKPSICRRAFVVYRPHKHLDQRGNEVHGYKWVTNVGFITSAGMTKETTNLVVDNGLHGLSDSTFASALEEYRFSEFKWDNIKTLTLGTIGKVDHEYACGYLTRTLPVITRISHGEIGSPQVNCGKLITSLLAHYSRQIDTYHGYKYFSLDGFPRNFKDVTRLDVCSGSIAELTKARNVPVKCLQILQLRGLTDEAVWSAFEHRPNEPIVFPELRKISLTFVSSYSPVQPRSFAECNLRFPKLQKLSGYDALSRFPDFYRTFLNTSLCALQILEREGNMHLVPPELVSSAHRLEVNDRTIGWNQQDLSSSLVASLLTITSPIRTAILASLGPVVDGSVNWPYLQKLQLNPTCIPYQDIDCLLTQLPRLWYLHINAGPRTDYARDNQDYPSSDATSSTVPLSKTLQHLVIRINSYDRVVMNTRWLQRLIVRAPALQKLYIPVEYANEFVQFVEDQERDIYIWRPAVPRYGHLLQQNARAVPSSPSLWINSVPRYLYNLVKEWISIDR